MLRRLATAVRGLDLIGWEEPDEQLPVTIALDATMIGALASDADHFGWAAEEAPESAEGRARAARNASAIESFLASLAQRR